MRRITKIFAVAALSASALLATPVASAQWFGKTAKDKDQSRTLNGNVRNKGGLALPGAIVYLKNTRSLAVRSYIADAEGGFHFHGLLPNVDYEIYAEYNGTRSPTKTLSSFDSRTVVDMELKIDVNK